MRLLPISMSFPGLLTMNLSCFFLRVINGSSVRSVSSLGMAGGLLFQPGLKFRVAASVWGVQSVWQHRARRWGLATTGQGEWQTRAAYLWALLHSGTKVVFSTWWASPVSSEFRLLFTFWVLDHIFLWHPPSFLKSFFLTPFKCLGFLFVFVFCVSASLSFVSVIILYLVLSLWLFSWLLLSSVKM